MSYMDPKEELKDRPLYEDYPIEYMKFPTKIKEKDQQTINRYSNLFIGQIAKSGERRSKPINKRLEKRGNYKNKFKRRAFLIKKREIIRNRK